jgi:phospholipid/cholesterol/gamma-HCH transport system permease protein
MNERSYLRIETVAEGYRISATGEWTTETVGDIEKALAPFRPDRHVILDISGIETFDGAGVLLWKDLQDRYADVGVTITGWDEAKRNMYALLSEKSPAATVPRRKGGFFASVGKGAVFRLRDAADFVEFLGRVVFAFLHLLRHPARFRYKETIYHIYHSGVTALLIVGLTSFLVGMVVAYQGAVQLAKFGADIFIVDTVGISVVRELGPMITAIVIAGRSGSAYTAEIGAMKITEEIAAMRTMGFDPFQFLVVPRIVALVVALPLLVFFADIVGIWGGMVASAMQLGLSFEQFSDRLNEVVGLKHYVLGMVKTPFFAFVIAAIGCFRGFQVTDNTESIGLQTTASVVNAIFLVIALDALFSVIYTEFGW